MKPKYLLPLSHDYKRVPNESGYNSCHFVTSVHGDSDWPRYSFPSHRRIGFRGFVIGLCLIVTSLFIAVFEYGVLDQLYINLFLK